MAASCDNSRRRRAMPAIRYSGRESTSRATNMSSRLFDDREDQHAADGEQRERKDLGLDPVAAGQFAGRAAIPRRRPPGATIGLRSSDRSRDEEHGQDRQHEDGALEKQSGAVDGQRAGHGGQRRAAQQNHGDERGDQAGDGKAQLRGVPLGARDERLDQHADAAQHRAR